MYDACIILHNIKSNIILLVYAEACVYSIYIYIIIMLVAQCKNIICSTIDIWHRVVYTGGSTCVATCLHAVSDNLTL